MMRIEKSLYVSLAFAAFVTVSCSNGGYKGFSAGGGDKKNSASGDIAVDKTEAKAGGEATRLGLQSLTCGDEVRTVPVNLSVNVSANEQLFELPTTCKSNVESEKLSSSKNPTDIVFVLDITGSMQVNINAIKSNVVGFASAIEQKGWNARFAAVGFRDAIESRHTFSDASALAIKLGSWGAGGGGDSQEFSQGGVLEALKMFDSDGASNPALMKSDKVILLVTDNPGWDPSSRNHGNFDTKSLETAIQDSAAKFPRLKFFHSTPKKSADPAFSLSPQEQYNDVLNNTGVSGSALDYPITDDVFLKQFVEKFEPVKEKREMNCKLTSAEVRDLSGIVRSDAFKLAEGKEQQQARITKKVIEKSSLAQIIAERCCSLPSEPAGSCSQKVTVRIPIRIK
jgi:hypothetical protein